MNRIFAKTTKGKNEIQTRENRLAYRVRQVLILVDSKRTYGDIKKMDLFPEQEFIAVMDSLVADGYIEVSVEAAVTSAPAAPVAASSAVSRPKPQDDIMDVAEHSEKEILEQLKQEREDAKKKEAALMAALKKSKEDAQYAAKLKAEMEKSDKEEQRRREREQVSGWSKNKF